MSIRLRFFSFLLFLMVLGTSVALTHRLGMPMVHLFHASPLFNTLILTVFTLSLMCALLHGIRLVKDESRILALKHSQAPLRLARSENAPASSVLHVLTPWVQKPLSASTLDYIISSAASHFSPSRHWLRYSSGLLILLGLLGTFMGLVSTVTTLASAINDLPATENTEDFIALLKLNLTHPLGGMSTAFSTALFGLASSLVVSFADMVLAGSQHRLLSQIEQWLIQSFCSADDTSSAPLNSASYTAGLATHVMEVLEKAQVHLTHTDQARIESYQSLATVAERLASLTDQARTEQALMVKIAEGQLKLYPLLERLSEKLSNPADAFDDATKSHLRHIDTACTRMAEECHLMRTQIQEDLIKELRLLTKVLSSKLPSSHESA